MLLRNLLGRDRNDGLMCGGVEGSTDRLDGRDMKSCQGSRQLFKGKIHALHEDIAAPSFSCGLDGPFEIVDDRQEFFQQLLIAESDLIALVPLGQPFIVIEFSGEAEILVVQPLTSSAFAASAS